MKIAIVYNRESNAVINLFGKLNMEKYGLNTINAIRDALKANGHQVKTFEGDKNIIKNLEEFMPAVIAGERPGLVFNLSYGIQGRSRYTHIPGILEMLGVPYVGSEPSTHAVALDKVVTKMILLQKNLPTPRFTVLDQPNDIIIEELRYPLIIKPRDETSSFGLKIIHNKKELREGVAELFNIFHSSILVEEYIDGREINVGLLGNNPVEALPPVELVFENGAKIFTNEDKAQGDAGRVRKICPAPLSPSETEQIQQLAIKTFKALGCFDSARVDFRIDSEGNPYILEINSMASLGLGASYVFAADKIGLDYQGLVQKLIDVTSERYFGKTTEAKQLDKTIPISYKRIFDHLTKNRDKIEDELKYWTNFSRGVDHPLGASAFQKRFQEKMLKLGMRKYETNVKSDSVFVWETKKGLEDGILLVVPLDVQEYSDQAHRTYRREPEWLFGNGIATRSAAITCMFKCIETLHAMKQLHNKCIGIFAYTDEGKGMRYSGTDLKNISGISRKVFVLQPGNEGGKVMVQRRGLRKFSIIVERNPIRVGSKKAKYDAYEWFADRINTIEKLASEYDRLDVSVSNINLSSYSMMRPHQLEAIVYMSYLNNNNANLIEKKLKSMFAVSSRVFKTAISNVEVRPPMLKSPIQKETLTELERICLCYGIPFATDSSLLPSAAGDVAEGVPVICGMTPSGKNLYTPDECISRAELLQKILLLSFYLSDQ